MWKVKTLQVYSFNGNAKAGIVVFIVLAIVVINFNLILNRVKPKIEDLLSRSSGRHVYIERILSFEPHKLVFSGVEISGGREIDEEKKMSLRKVVVTFSIYKMLLERKITLSRVEIIDPVVYDKNEILYLSKKCKKGNNLFNTLKWQSLGVIVENGTLIEKENGDQYKTIFNLDFNNELGTINIFGDVLKCRKSDCENISPIEFIGSVAAENEGLVFNKIDLRKEGWFFLGLNGHSNGNRIFLKGYGFSEERTPPDEEVVPEEKSDMIEALNRIFLKIGSKGFEEINAGAMNVLDINSEFSINKNIVKIERFRSTVNNIPVSLSGEVQVSDALGYDISSVAYFSKSNNGMKKSISELSINLKGQVRKGVLQGDVNAAVSYEESSELNKYVGSSGISFSNVSTDLNTYPKYSLNAERVALFFEKNRIVQEIIFNRSKAEIDLAYKDGKNINIDSELFGGKVLANININQENQLNVTNAIINFKELDISKINGLLYDFSILKGKVNSRISFTDYPGLDVKGDLDIRDGYLTNAGFLDWLSEYFDIAGVRSIEGYGLGLQFRINKNSLDIYDVMIDSKKINLNGYFKIREYANVSSEFRMEFDKEMMKESKRFRSLLKRIKDDRQLVAFDFRLLGDINKINFQWMQSEFKEAATGVIPNFIKRKIERNIEKAIK